MEQESVEQQQVRGDGRTGDLVHDGLAVLLAVGLQQARQLEQAVGDGVGLHVPQQRPHLGVGDGNGGRGAGHDWVREASRLRHSQKVIDVQCTANALAPQHLDFPPPPAQSPCVLLKCRLLLSPHCTGIVPALPGCLSLLIAHVLHARSLAACLQSLHLYCTRASCQRLRSDRVAQTQIRETYRDRKRYRRLQETTPNPKPKEKIGKASRNSRRVKQTTPPQQLERQM
jgi:hypothetical protein